MRFFKRAKQQEGNAQPGQDKLARKIVAVVSTVQNGFARFMTQRTKNLSMLSMKWLLILFTLTGSGVSIYLVAFAVAKNPKKQLRIDRIHVPKYYDQNGDPITIPNLIIHPQEHEEMELFQNYMDSLRASKNGKRIYDSILMSRPGLLDSVHMLEKIYQSQNKK